MNDQSHAPHRVRFGTFEVDLATGELWKSGRKLKLTGQPFSVLAILLERPGEVISREQFQRQLWSDTFVDVGHNWARWKSLWDSDLTGVTDDQSCRSGEGSTLNLLTKSATVMAM